MWEIFHDARDRNPTERSLYLKSVLCENEELHNTIHDLLAADEASNGLFEDLIVSELNLVAGRAFETHEAQPGDVLSDRFEIVQKLGSGGMGSVYEAIDRELGASVALKMIRNDLAFDSSARERFHREINLARQITHPNACRIFDLFHHGDLLFVSMELIRGETLHERIRYGGPFKITSALPVIEEIVNALSAIHRQGIVHRDLKTSNIMLAHDSKGLRAVVMDFGVAISIPEQSNLGVTGTGQILGTPEFMAPEQLTKGKITAATDIYALGLVMYEMLTGIVPWSEESPVTIVAKKISEDPPSPRAVLPDLDAKWDRAIRRALDRNSSRRFQKAEELLKALTDNSIAARFPPVSSRTKQYTLLLLVAIAIAAGAMLLWIRRPAQSQSETSSDIVVKRLLTGGTGLPGGVLSSDGKILIDVDWQTADLVATDLHTRAGKRITHSSKWFLPHDYSHYPVFTALSRDGSRVAYSDQQSQDHRCDLKIAGVKTKSERILLSNTQRCAHPLDWSNDGRLIASLLVENTSGRSAITLVSAVNGSLRTLKMLDSSDIRKMNFSPDGRFVLFDYPQEAGSASHDLFLISVETGEETRVVASKANDYLLGWTPAGDGIVFASDRSGTMDAWLLPFTNGRPSQDPQVARKDIGQIYPLRITADGSLYYAHLLTSTDLYSAEIHPNSIAMKLHYGVVGSNSSPDFSPDGKLLLFTTLKDPLARRWQYSAPTILKLLSLQTLQEREIPNQVKSVGPHVRWSPSGNAVLIYGIDEKSGQGGLYQLNPITGEASHVLSNPENNWIREFDWYDQASLFYLLNKGGRLLRRDVAGGKEDLIFTNVATFAYSPKRKLLAVANADVDKGTISLKITNSNGEESRELLRLRLPEFIPAMAWSTDGSSLFIAKGRRDLIDAPHKVWQLSIADARLHELGMPTEYVYDLRPHPDGKHLVIYCGTDTSELWVMQNFLGNRADLTR